MDKKYHVIVDTSNWAEIVQWLQYNVGTLLWKQPIISWHGDGWHMKSTPKVNQRGLSAKPCFTVEFDNEKMAMLFALKWS
jgi:hypothetical protein